MSIREKTPDKILVGTDFLKSAAKEDEELNATKTEYESSKNVCLALMGALASCVLTIVPSWADWGVLIKFAMFVFTAIFALCTIWFFIKFLNAKSKLERMKYDIEMGRRAGTRTCGVTYGNGSPQELREAGADFMVNDFEKILTLI